MHSLFKNVASGELERRGIDKKYLYHRGLLIIGSLLEFNDPEKTNALLTEAYELLGRQSSRMFRQTMMTYGAPIMILICGRGEKRR